MTASDPALPDLGRLPGSVLRRLIADATRLRSVPAGPLPVFDDWAFVGGGPDLLYARGYLEGGAERLKLPLLAIMPERPAAWLVGTGWVELGAAAFGQDGEELPALLARAERWCEALRAELGSHNGR
jgi:hypothetical protein